MRELLPRIALVGALLSMWPAFADEISQMPAARMLVSNCGNAADSDTSGIQALEAVCPGLLAALQQLGATERLYPGWEDELNVYALDAIVTLHDRYQTTPSILGPDPGSLRQVLSEFEQAQAPPPSLWERFKSWLNEWLSGEDRQAPTWLEEMLERLTVPAVVMKIILYSLLAAIVAMAIAVIVIELRAAGLFAKRNAAGRAMLGDSPDALFGKSATMGDVEAAPLLERPAMLLRLLVSALVAKRRLAAARGLTHRELAQRAQLQTLDRVRFERLTRLAETIRFGRAVSADDALVAEAQPVLAEARVLYDQLQHADTSGKQPS
jgi:hypothetical protein